MAKVEKQSGLLELVRPEILSLPGYEPVEPIETLSAHLGIAPERIAKLDGNENPYGPSPLALARLAAFQGYNIYPDPDQGVLREALSRYLGVPPEFLIAGAGSDELIQLLASVFLSAGDAVIDLVPTFGMYAFETDIAGGRSVPIERRADFSVDVTRVAEAIDDRTRLIFATSPNNPTGNLLTPTELDGLLDLGLPVVVDEAYIEFSGAESCISQVLKRQNLIVMRTFSKWAGLAGLRVGYAAMAPELVDMLFRVRQPYSINVAAEVASVASLEDAATLDERARLIVAERETLARALSEIPFLQPLPSQGNFILCNVLRGSAREIRDRLRGFGVFVRYFDRPLLQNCIRISVGLPQHTQQVSQALGRIGGDLGLV